MKNSSQNINLSGLNLPQRLRELRESQNLTQADLGEKAGLSYRTIHDLELGKRNRVQEKTLTLLAQALEITLPELTNIPIGNGSPMPTPHNPFPWKILVPLLVVILLAAGLITRHWALANARWEIHDHKLVVRDAVLGSELWSMGQQFSPRVCLLAPWSDSILILSFQGVTPRGRNIMAIGRSTGDILWAAQPDLDAVRAAFGPDVFDGGNLTCGDILTVDLNQDGQSELLAMFQHTQNYPGILLWLDQNGKPLGQYANHGQFNDILETDLDADGKTEIIASGTNNARVYAGATVVILDADHFRGASVDSLNHAGSTEPDSCRVRLVVPNWPEPYMDSLHSKRFHAKNITVFSDDNGKANLSFDFGPNQLLLGNLLLDHNLTPQGFVLQDFFVENLAQYFAPDLTTNTGPTDPAWLATWLARNYRFGAEP